MQLVSHWMACAWMLQAVVYNAWFDDLESTWLAKAGVDLDADSLQSRYIQAMYFSITIMATIGFGDITPSNGYERMLCIAAMVWSIPVAVPMFIQCLMSSIMTCTIDLFNGGADSWNLVLRILHHTAGRAGC